MAPPARSFRLLLAAALALGFAGAARADLRVFKATLTLEGITLPPPAIATGIGVATVNGSGSGAHVSMLQLPADILSGPATLDVTPTSSFPVTQVKLDFKVGVGLLKVGPSSLTGPMPVKGSVRMCAAGCGLFLDAPLTVGGTRGLGIGGTVMGPMGAAGRLTLAGGRWKTGMVGIATSSGVVSRTGFAHGPLSGTSSTAAPQGVLQLVTPIAVRLSAAPGLVIPVFGVLEVKLLPEPGAGVLLGSGAVLLALIGARRSRSAR